MPGAYFNQNPIIMCKHQIPLFPSLLLCPFLLLAQGDLTADQAAIKKTIEAETAAIQACDLATFSDQWWHEDYCYFSVTTPTFHWGFYGWDEIGAWAKEQVANCDPANAPGSRKYDYRYTINGNMAFVTFLEDAGNESTRVLEKRDGRWKLIRMGVIATTGFDAQEKQHQLARFEGTWKGDLSTFTVDPPATDWELLAFQFKNESTPSGIRLLHQRDWKNANGSWVYTRRMELASGSGQEEMGLFVAGHNTDGWTHYNQGTATLMADGTLMQKTKRTGQDKLSETAWLSIGEDGRLHIKVEMYDEDGAVDGTFMIAMDRQ